VGADQLTLRHQLPPHPDIVSSVVFDRAGTLLATRCRSQLIKIWTPDTGKLVRSLTDFDAEINSTAFLPDSTGLFIGSDHEHARLVDADSGRILSSVMSTSKILVTAVSPKGSYLATADGANVHLWNTKTGEWVRTMGDGSNGHTDDVYSLAFSPDGTTLASGSDDNKVILWNFSTGTPKQALTGHTHWVRGLAFHPNGRQLASASYDQTVRIWNPATGETLQTLSGHTQSVRAVAYRSDGKMLATGGLEPLIRLWDPANGKELTSIPLTDPGEITSLAFQPRGILLASGGSGNAVRLWNSDAGELTLTLNGHFLPVTALAFDPDGSRLASGSKDYTVRVWDTVTGGLLNIIGDKRR
jgi:WD40 repeat protein